MQSVTEGIVKLWRAKANTKKFITFLDDLKKNPDKFMKYLEDIKRKDLNKNKDKTIINVKHNETITVENNGKMISVTKIREENFTTTSTASVEEILGEIVPAKSFLYRNQTKKFEKLGNFYLPMNVGTSVKKRRSKFFRLSSHEYPLFDLSKFKYFSNKNEYFNDRGYYCVKKSLNGRSIEDIYTSPEPKVRRKSQSSAENIELNDKIHPYIEDHFYEDLCYNDVVNDQIKRNRSNSSASNDNSPRIPRSLKIHEIFHSFKMPSFLKTNDWDIFKERKKTEKVADVVENTECNNDNMYDSVLVNSILVDNGNSNAQVRFTASFRKVL